MLIRWSNQSLISFNVGRWIETIYIGKVRRLFSNLENGNILHRLIVKLILEVFIVFFYFVNFLLFLWTIWLSFFWPFFTFLPLLSIICRWYLYYFFHQHVMVLDVLHWLSCVKTQPFKNHVQGFRTYFNTRNRLSCPLLKIFFEFWTQAFQVPIKYILTWNLMELIQGFLRVKATVKEIYL
jgi:hypothetical protein